MIYHKMFVEVDTKDLAVNTKYAIIATFDAGIYTTAIFDSYRRGNPRFHTPKEHSGDTYNKLVTIRNKKNNPNFYVFVPQKDKIQRDMEQRAFDKIVKRLINDDFTW